MNWYTEMYLPAHQSLTFTISPIEHQIWDDEDMFLGRKLSPFWEDSPHLLAISVKEQVHCAVVDSLHCRLMPHSCLFPLCDTEGFSFLRIEIFKSN